MEVISSYSVRITSSQYRKAFKDILALYRAAVDFFIDVMLKHWGTEFEAKMDTQRRKGMAELLCCPIARRPSVLYDFSQELWFCPKLG